jgi:RNAse (barnase) inhibitor barstar
MDEQAKRFEASASGVYRVSAAHGIAEAGRIAGLEVCTVHLRQASDKAALLRAVAAALAFPEWFGENWDALEDCLTDLSWRPGGHVVLVEGHERLPGEVSRTFVEILASAAGFWAARGTAFFAVFVDAQQALALPELGP